MGRRRLNNTTQPTTTMPHPINLENADRDPSDETLDNLSDSELASLYKDLNGGAGTTDLFDRVQKRLADRALDTFTTEDNTSSDEPTLISTFTEPPTPSTPSEVDEFIENDPTVNKEAGDLSVDGFHEDYKHVLVETDEWQIYRLSLYGYGSYFIVQNTMLGEGFMVPDDEWAFGTLVEAMALMQSDDLPRKRDDDPVKPENRGCPYCPDADSGDLTSSTAPDGTQKQTCTRCGRSRFIG